MKSFLLFAAFSLSLGLTGCVHDLPEGEFKATLTTSGCGSLPDFQVEPVVLSVSHGVLHSAEIHILDPGRKRIAQPISIAHFSRKLPLLKTGFELTIPDLSESPFRLVKDGHGGGHCFHGKDQGHSIEACLTDVEFTIEVSRNSGIQCRIFGYTREKPEKPHSGQYTVKDLIQVAMEKNTDVRIENEAKNRAVASMLESVFALTPHLGTNSIVAIATAAALNDPAALVGGAGDLVPFLFPNRWLNAVAGVHLYRAEKVTKLIVRNDVAYAVHSLTIDLIHSRSLFFKLSQVYQDMAQVLRLAGKMAEDGLIDGDEINRVRIKIHDLYQTVSDLGTEVEEKFLGLAQLLALSDPNEIEDVREEDRAISFSFENVKIPETEKKMELLQRRYTEAVMFARPLEVAQLYYLKDAAETEKRKVLVNWLDPNQQGNLGLMMIPQFWQKASEEQTLDIRLDETIKNIRTQTYLTVRRFYDALGSYREASDNLTLRFHQYHNAVVPFRARYPGGISAADVTGGEVSIDKLIDAMESLVEGYTRESVRLSLVERSQAKLDQLTLQGIYQSAKKERTRVEIESEGMRRSVVDKLRFLAEDLRTTIIP